MTDKKENTETKATATEPYLKKDSKNASSQMKSGTQSEKNKYFIPLVLLVVVIAIILTTIYKFYDERSTKLAHTDTQENTEITEPASAAMIQASPSINTPDQLVQSTNENISNEIIDEQANTQTNELESQQLAETTNNDAQMAGSDDDSDRSESIAQRRQEYEKEIESKQKELQALMAQREEDRIETVAKLKEEYQRIQEKQQEIRMKAQEIQKEIYNLHEKRFQLMREARAQNRQ